MYKIMVLGGYGMFGRRICESLAKDNNIELVVAGRNLGKAQKLCQVLQTQNSNCHVYPISIDVIKDNFLECLRKIKPQIVIHTCGPFQGQSYDVPQACINAQVHYIDLADDRQYVCDIKKLNDMAVKQGVILISGASSVPGLSSAVINHYLSEFKHLQIIDFSIAPGNRAERGLATVSAILSYTGHPFKSWIQNSWQDIYGWMDLKRQDYGFPIGKRWLANVDIPDLSLFPEYYKGVRTVRFRAGLELSLLHLIMHLMAAFAKMKWINNGSKYAKPITKLSDFFKPFGTGIGGMMMTLEGIGKNDKPHRVTWKLIADNGCGPYIPTFSSILLVKKIINNQMKFTGSRPCLGLFSLPEFLAIAKAWGIYHIEDKN